MSERSDAWKLLIHPQAEKELGSLEAYIRGEIENATEEFQDSPYHSKVQRLMNGDEQFRSRVGNYRVFFDIDKEARAVLILYVKRRTSTTY